MAGDAGQGGFVSDWRVAMPPSPLLSCPRHAHSTAAQSSLRSMASCQHRANQIKQNRRGAEDCAEMGERKLIRLRIRRIVAETDLRGLASARTWFKSDRVVSELAKRPGNGAPVWPTFL